jgi:hypothetical protein
VVDADEPWKAGISVQPILPELRGLQVLLRPPREADKSDRLEYGRNAEFVRMVGGDATGLRR